MSRIQLANHFKQQAFDAIGVNPQRLGAPMGQETATGIVNAMNQSYAQTEMYFTQHADQLMPRVHQMRTDLAQFYQSTKPSVRLSYITSEAEKVNFVINGTDLLMRDFNIFTTTKANHRQILEQLKQMAIQNNTTGASIYDLGNIIKAESIAEVSDILKDAEMKTQAQRQQEMQQQQQMQQEQLQAQQQQEQMRIQAEAEEAEKERQKDITVAEIRSAGYGAQSDINQNQISDFKDAMNDMKETARYREQMDLNRTKSVIEQQQNKSKMDIERERLRTQQSVANTQLQIARENKNKYDVQAKRKQKKEK